MCFPSSETEVCSEQHNDTLNILKRQSRTRPKAKSRNNVKAQKETAAWQQGMHI